MTVTFRRDRTTPPLTGEPTISPQEATAEATADRNANVPIAASRAPAGPRRLSAAPPSSAFSLGALVRAARPKQWSKNVLVAAAPCAAGAIAKPEIALTTGLAFVVFCLLSSATYLLNDVRDAE